MPVKNTVLIISTQYNIKWKSALFRYIVNSLHAAQNHLDKSIIWVWDQFCIFRAAMFFLEMKVNQLCDFKIMIPSPIEQVPPSPYSASPSHSSGAYKWHTHTFLVIPSLVADAPSVAGAALFPHFNHAGESLDTRLMSPQHGHLLISTNIWPVHGKHIKMKIRWTDARKKTKTLHAVMMTFEANMWVLHCCCIQCVEVGSWLSWEVGCRASHGSLSLLQSQCVFQQTWTSTCSTHVQ